MYNISSLSSIGLLSKSISCEAFLSTPLWYVGPTQNEIFKKYSILKYSTILPSGFNNFGSILSAVVALLPEGAFVIGEQLKLDDRLIGLEPGVDGVDAELINITTIGMMEM